MRIKKVPTVPGTSCEDWFSAQGDRIVCVDSFIRTNQLGYFYKQMNCLFVTR